MERASRNPIEGPVRVFRQQSIRHWDYIDVENSVVQNLHSRWGKEEGHMLWFEDASTKAPDQVGLLLRGPDEETYACRGSGIRHQSKVLVSSETYAPCFALCFRWSGMPQTGYSFGEKYMFVWSVLEDDVMRNKIVPSYPTVDSREAEEFGSR